MNEQISTVRGWRGSADIWRNSLRKMFERCGFSVAHCRGPRIAIGANSDLCRNLGPASAHTQDVSGLPMIIADRHDRSIPPIKQRL